MKCKHCNGTGKIMEESDNGIGWIPVKCEYCNGTGEILGLHGIYEKCPVCSNSGSNGQQTNEEWFCALPTKEKAKWLASKQGGHKVMQEMKAKAWEEWLQEKHVND